MRISAKAMHAMRALISMKTDWPEGSNWYTIRNGLVHTDGSRSEYKGQVWNRDTSTDHEVVETYADIDIHDEIGSYGVNAKDFMRDLKSLNVDTINLSLHSPGGEYHDGLAIYNALKEHPAKVNVKVMGLAASAASFISLAGDYVSMHKRSELMIHKASGCGIGNADEIGKTVKVLDRADKNIAGIYVDAARSRLGKDALNEEDFMALMSEETWFTPEEALDQGLIDNIIGGDDDVDDEVDSDVAIKNIHSAAFASLIALAAEAGFNVDLENKVLSTVDTVDSVVNGKPEDQALFDEPIQVKVEGKDLVNSTDYQVKNIVDNGDDLPKDENLRLRLAALNVTL